MQNVAQGSGADNNPKIEKVVNQQQQHDIGNSNSSSTPHSHSTTNSSPAKSETETYSEHRQYISDTSESEEDSVSEVESFVIDDGDNSLEAAKFLLSAQQNRTVDPLTQARIEQLLQAAGIGQLATKDGKHLADPEVLRRLTSSVSSALDEAAAALTRMRSDTYPGNNQQQQAQQPQQLPQQQQQPQLPEKTSLVDACTDGDVCTVKKLLTEGRSVHETSEEGESLLSLACSAGYYELAQVLLAMNANVEDRGIKGECTPLMEAASAGHLDIVRLLVRHGAEVNAQSTTGNTPLMYGCAGGHQDVVKFLLEKGANVEDHNENGHTPLMEAASAGHVGLAKILLLHGAGINTHSNEFKESALTLACYKGHLDMVKFLLEAGADQEHKTDEMHTALMEASMDGHVEVARLLLDSGAQVNMPTDSFESPLTLAACGGHVDLAMLLIERGANIEEVNDEGYTPLMEAAREGHEDMVTLLLNQGAHINAQTDETQETALTLACCGGFTEVADFLYQGGADIELGASTPLMEAAQEGHLKLVEYLLEKNANVHATTQTGDTALTYACENGHTDVVDKLLQYGADLEHESEGGRTPLMKACRAGHHCAVQFLISKGANVHRQTTNNDHTPLSLACAGGHLNVVELLLATGADPNHKLKDNSTMLIEAAKGGHTTVVQLLLDFPHSMLMNQPSATAAAMLPGHVSPLPSHPTQRMNFFQPAPDFSPAVLQEVPEAVRIVPQDEGDKQLAESTSPQRPTDAVAGGKDGARTSGVNVIFDATLTTAEAQQVRSQPLTFTEYEDCGLYAATTATMEFLAKQSQDKKPSILEYVKNRKKLPIQIPPALTDEGTQKQQILEELHRVDREFSGKQQQQQQPPNLFPPIAVPQDDNNPNAPLPHRSIIDIDIQDDGMSKRSLFSGQDLNAFYAGVQAADLIYQTTQNQQPPFCFPPIAQPSTTTTQQPLGGLSTTTATTTQPVKIHTLASHAEVSQNTAISDRPKAKPVSKKEGKNVRKVYTFQQLPPPQLPMPTLQQDALPVLPAASTAATGTDKTSPMSYPLDLDALDSMASGEDATPDSFSTANILQDLHNHPLIRAAFVSSPSAAVTSSTPPVTAHATTLTCAGSNKKNNIDFVFKSAATKFIETRTNLQDYMVDDLYNIGPEQQSQQSQSPVTSQFPESLDDTMLASLSHPQHEHDLVGDGDRDNDGDVSRVEYFAVPNHGVGGVDLQRTFDPYEQYLQAVGNNSTTGTLIKASFCRGFQAQANYSRMQQTLDARGNTKDADVAGVEQQQQEDAGIYYTVGDATLPSAAGAAAEVAMPRSDLPTCTHIGPTTIVQTNNYCQVSCSQHSNNQVQAATQTQGALAPTPTDGVGTGIGTKKCTKVPAPAANANAAPAVSQDSNVKKKDRYLYRNVQKKKLIDPNALIGSQYGDAVAVHCPAADQANFCMDVDSETESNHDTALTLACAGGHEDLVGLLINHGAHIEHRDKKGFTPLILAATAGHEKVVELLLKHNADIEAQSERTKDTPLSLACSGGRYEVVEILLNRNSNKEHRNVSDYTPLSLAASGGYVNIIKLLLHQGAEINSRTGSKLGISPLMLAAMNGHTAAVKLLLDMGSDINAQIETNRNTALTLACFQGRHEVVSLLLDRKANVEHRAKTGLTPLMEAASGGYVDVGRVLLDKGADVNATPVPSSRDTALTIAADKGHVRFVDLLLNRGAAVEVKNKKGNSPLWLAANGGHLNVVELLHGLGADIDSQDNRKVSCLMAAYRKGHVKVVKWMVNHVTQFPSDQEMIRYMATVSEKDNDLVDKCHECIKIIRAAKETQAAKANKNASILLEELDMEKNREESKKAAAARKRERKKKKKLEKKEEKRKLFEENKKNEYYEDKNDDDDDDDDEEEDKKKDKEPAVVEHSADKEEGDSGIDANSQGSCSSNDVKSKEKRKDKKKKKPSSMVVPVASTVATTANTSCAPVSTTSGSVSNQLVKEKFVIPSKPESKKEKQKTKNELRKEKLQMQQWTHQQQQQQQHLHDVCTKSPADRDEFEPSGSDSFVTPRKKEPEIKASPSSSTSPKQSGSKREEGWKEVVRKSSVQPAQSDSGVKKVSVPLNAISRVIGRGGSNINAIRGATGAHIEVEKQSKGQGERIITIKGSPDATKHAHTLIMVLIRDPDADIMQMLHKAKATPVATTLWDKTQIGTKKVAGKALAVGASTSAAATVVSAQPQLQTQQKVASGTGTTAQVAAVRSSASLLTVTKPRLPTSATPAREPARDVRDPRDSRVVPPPRLAAQAEKEKAQQQQQLLQQQQPQRIGSSARLQQTTSSNNKITSFAAKLSDLAAAPQIINTMQPQLMPLHQHLSQQLQPQKTRLNAVVPPPSGPVSPNAQSTHHQQASTQSSPKHSNARPAPTSSAPPNMQQQQVQGQIQQVAIKAFSHANTAINVITSEQAASSQPCSPTPNNPAAMNKPAEDVVQNNVQLSTATSTTQSVYTLFNDFAKPPMWRHHDAHESQKPQNFATVTGSNVGGGGPGAHTAVVTNQNVKYDQPCVPDASKAPGYRGNAMCSPVSSKTSSNSTTPPSYHYDKPSSIAPIGSHMHNLNHRPSSQNQNQNQQNQEAANCYFDRSHLSLDSVGGGPAGMYKPMAPSYSGDATATLGSFPPYQNTISQHLNFSQGQQQQDSRLNPKAPDFHGKQNHNLQMYNGYNNMFNTSKQGMFQQQQQPPQQNNPNAWMQFNHNNEHHPLINGMAGMTLQHIARATDPMYDTNHGVDLVTNSPALSPKAMMHYGDLQSQMGGGAGEDRKASHQPAPIGIERSRKMNPGDNGWMKERPGNSMQQMWQQGAPRIPNPLENRDMNNYLQRAAGNIPPMYDYYPDSHSIGVLMESNLNMPYQSQHHQMPMASNLGLEYQPDYKMTTWDSRSNNVDMQDKQQLGWSSGVATNKWSS